jgi:hypothetical protein
VQKSIEGLLRAVLHALLSGLSQSGVSENLETIQHVCEPRWHSTDKGRAWNFRELKDMLSRLALTSRVKIFLLIDALDECDPQDRLCDLADVIIWLSRLPNVKLCVSCRPWAAFTKRFDMATVLHLDRLTYHDMEVYIEKRLLGAEAEAELCSDFHDGTLPAKQLIYDVANAANGVFLWVELVVNALCSEIRTGCSIEHLSLAIDDFPADLDDYFRKLIFGRIGTTRPNVPKTAAALKLAMVLKSHKVETSHTPFGAPMPDDYLNFWLLSVGQLKPGFSWADQLDPQHLALNTENKFRQTKAFLEETCKDLLVIHKSKHAYNVDFMHRTIFDFLRDNPTSLPIEKYAPRHFSDEDFAMDLLKLRCICRLRENIMDCTSSGRLLEAILVFSRHGTDPEIHKPWLLACESTLLETYQTRCDCLGLQHLNTRAFAEYCAVLGLHRCLLDTVQNMPHEAVSRRKNSSEKEDYLTLALLALEVADTRKVTAIHLLNQALECGCDPNVSLWTDDFDDRCRQTRWERWLQVQYLDSQRRSRAARRGDEAHQSIDAAQDIACKRIQENASIIDLLLRHGTNPDCTICAADHQFESMCSPMSFSDILQFIVPADRLSSLQTLLVACSNEDRRNAFRRNQRKKAIRSYTISEQRFASRIIDRCPQGLQECEREHWAKLHRHEWRHQQTMFLKSLINSDEIGVECETWEESKNYTSLLTWCLDCGSSSHACLGCLPPHSLAEDAACTTFSNLRIAQPQGHTTVAIIFYDRPKGYDRWAFGMHEYLAVPSAARQLLGYGPSELDLTPEAAISVLKEWYAKNPIDPDASQEEDFQDSASMDEFSLHPNQRRRHTCCAVS